MERKKSGFAFAIIIFLVALFFFAKMFVNVSSMSDEETNVILCKSVDRAITDCYAIEGMYPPNFKYLEQNYGINIDDEKYYVDYQVFASNVRPVVMIIKRGSLSTAGEING